jgi:K+-sensing histidine kinase KdpD
MDTHPSRNSQALQTALANALCYVIASLDDPHVAVAQRTALYLGTIHDSAVQVSVTRSVMCSVLPIFRFDCNLFQKNVMPTDVLAFPELDVLP